ncbi:MAG: LytTR family DNA-binding domain-containing protein [Bacteroidota bacterium]
MLIKKIKNYFERPFPLLIDTKAKWWTSTKIGLFIFLFLYLFQPFELDDSPNVLSITAGYGFIAFSITALFLFVVPVLFSNYFKEETWTVKKELIYKVSPVFFIGLANTIYSTQIYLLDSFWESFFYFEICTLVVGIFPLTYFVYLIEKQSDIKYRKISNEIMPPNHVISQTSDLAKAEQKVELATLNGKVELEINQQQILYIKSSSNYIEVIYHQDTELEKQLIRNTISNIEAQLKGHDIFYRCHKSYIVNLAHIQRISGNARGLKIHFSKLEESIPVSRKNNEALKQLLALR